jgi:hypothetical protein
MGYIADEQPVVGEAPGQRGPMDMCWVPWSWFVEYVEAKDLG